MYKTVKILLLITTLCFTYGSRCGAQSFYGTTGLLHLPTADMQRDGTFMIGGNYLNTHATPDMWYYDTWNYYINITLLPFLEVGYDMTLLKGSHLFKKFPKIRRSAYHRWANQDRNFSARLRVIKEGQFWEWMPQVVIGGNDILHTFSHKDDSKIGITPMGNGYWGRFYLAITKHFSFEGIGELGAHFAWMYNERRDFKYKGPGMGANFHFGVNDEQLGGKLLNGLDLIAEYDSRSINAGMRYSIWKDHINLMAELNEFKYFSGGVIFKLFLK